MNIILDEKLEPLYQTVIMRNAGEHTPILGMNAKHIARLEHQARSGKRKLDMVYLLSGAPTCKKHAVEDFDREWPFLTVIQGAFNLAS